MMTREHLHELIDQLPDNDIADVSYIVAYRHDPKRDPVLFALLTAPVDDEPRTPEELAAIEEALADVRHGRTLSLETLRAELEA